MFKKLLQTWISLRRILFFFFRLRFPPTAKEGCLLFATGPTPPCNGHPAAVRVGGAEGLGGSKGGVEAQGCLRSRDCCLGSGQRCAARSQLRGEEAARIQVFAPLAGQRPVTLGWFDGRLWWRCACLHIHLRWRGVRCGAESPLGLSFLWGVMRNIRMR